MKKSVSFLYRSLLMLANTCVVLWSFYKWQVFSCMSCLSALSFSEAWIIWTPTLTHYTFLLQSHLQTHCGFLFTSTASKQHLTSSNSRHVLALEMSHCFGISWFCVFSRHSLNYFSQDLTVILSQTEFDFRNWITFLYLSINHKHNFIFTTFFVTSV